MSRLVEATLVNVSRIEGVWKIIVTHFDILSSCPVLVIRQLTIEALQTIVLEIFAHKKISMKTKKLVLTKEIEQCCGDASPETETPAILDDVSSDDPETKEEEEAWADFTW